MPVSASGTEFDATVPDSVKLTCLRTSKTREHATHNKIVRFEIAVGSSVNLLRLRADIKIIRTDKSSHHLWVRFEIASDLGI